jgi:hypothetical protein
MARRFGYMVITFMDGTSQRIGGNGDNLKGDGAVLSVWTDDGYGGLRDVRNFPVANIREYHWER